MIRDMLCCALCCWAALSCSVGSDALRHHKLEPTRLLCPWTFSRQEYWSGLPCPPPGDLPTPGIEPRCPTLQASSLPAESQGKPKNTGVGSLSSPAAAAAKSQQLCPTLCDPTDGSLPDSSVHGIFQARVLEWVAIAFSIFFSRSSQSRNRTRVSCIAGGFFTN